MKFLSKSLGILSFTVLMASTSALHAADDSAELSLMLNEFLAGASIDDVAAHERFWADDLIYTTSGGERIDKADIMNGLAGGSDSDGEETGIIYTAEEVQIQQYGDTAIVAFKLVGTSGVDVDGEVVVSEVQEYFNTGTFLRRDGQWQVVAWQATRIPAAE